MVVLESEVQSLNGRAYDAWQSYQHHLGWNVACIANLTTKTFKDGNRIISLVDDMMNRISKLLDTHLHIFFGAREDHNKRPHLHMVVFTEKSFCPILTQKLILLIQGEWERYGDAKRQDISTPRGGNYMGYVISKNDGQEAHFIDRFFCPKTGACSKRKRNKTRCIYKHRA